MNLNQNTANMRMSFKDKERTLKEFSNTINPSGNYDRTAAKVAEVISGNTPRSNKDSRNIITKFLQDIDVESLAAVFLMAGTAITSAIKFYRNMRNVNKSMHRMDEDTSIDIYTPIDDIDIDSDKIQDLFESEEFQNLDINQQKEIEFEIKDSNIKKVLDDNKTHFVFDSGHYMEAINSNKLSDIAFSLKYHKNKTENVDAFIDSVVNFVSNVTKVTEQDIKRLKAHYNKYRSK